MPTFVLRVARREADGTFGLPVQEFVIEAASAPDAIAQAKSIDIDMIGLAANAIYLSDKAGRTLWSLRLQDVLPERGG